MYLVLVTTRVNGLYNPAYNKHLLLFFFTTTNIFVVFNYVHFSHWACCLIVHITETTQDPHQALTVQKSRNSRARSSVCCWRTWSTSTQSQFSTRTRILNTLCTSLCWKLPDFTWEVCTSRFIFIYGSFKRIKERSEILKSGICDEVENSVVCWRWCTTMLQGLICIMKKFEWSCNALIVQGINVYDITL